MIGRNFDSRSEILWHWNFRSQTGDLLDQRTAGGDGVYYGVPFTRMTEFCRWLVNSPWSHWMNSAEWVFPAVQSIHFIGFAMSIGTIAIVDLRLLGVGNRRWTALELYSDLAPWTMAGIVVMLTTGPLMFSTDAVAYHFNPSFQFKMACLTLALLFHFTLHRRAVRADITPMAAKMAAGVSLLLWSAVVFGGRFIAFV